MSHNSTLLARNSGRSQSESVSVKSQQDLAMAFSTTNNRYTSLSDTSFRSHHSSIAQYPTDLPIKRPFTYPCTVPGPLPGQNPWPAHNLNFQKQSLSNRYSTMETAPEEYHTQNIPFSRGLYHSSPSASTEDSSGTSVSDNYGMMMLSNEAVLGEYAEQAHFSHRKLSDSEVWPPNEVLYPFLCQTKSTHETGPCVPSTKHVEEPPGAYPLLPEGRTATEVSQESSKPDALHLRKMHHRTAEQRRRDDFKSSLAELGMLIPRAVHSRSNKLVLIKQAVDHIHYLQSEIRDREQEIERLKWVINHRP
ncbi:hypothetical protein K7432_012958 [Basidiobolus ranarum]|uniref:BHLH domain-containing protein n=1 Tax=Basidiobolus ranarum TaxID=34480 RepID=A0ABR2VRH1_9FUNG